MPKACRTPRGRHAAHARTPPHVPEPLPWRAWHPQAKKWQRRWCVLDEENFRYCKKNGEDRLIISGVTTWASVSVARTGGALGCF